MFIQHGRSFRWGLTCVRDWQRFKAAPSAGRAETSTPGGVRSRARPPAPTLTNAPSSSSSLLPAFSRTFLSSSSCRVLSACRPCTSETCWSPAAGWCPPPPPAWSWWGGSLCLRGVWSAWCCRWCSGWCPSRPPAARRRRRCCFRLRWWSGPGGRGSPQCGLRPKAPAATCGA